jgi:hypothetical protein
MILLICFFVSTIRFVSSGFNIFFACLLNFNMESLISMLNLSLTFSMASTLISYETLFSNLLDKSFITLWQTIDTLLSDIYILSISLLMLFYR